VWLIAALHEQKLEFKTKFFSDIASYIQVVHIPIEPTSHGISSI